MFLTTEEGQVRLETQRRRVCALAEAAEAHRSRARYGKAESLLLEALAIAVKAFGHEDLVAVSLLNFERALGRRHPNTVACRANYARLLRDMDRPRGR
jgi:hypothetical protein